MDSARQILRWGIPGWLWAICLVIVDAIEVKILSPQDFDPLTQNIQKAAGIGSILTGLVVSFVAASVPIGFLFYQIYYWTSWRGPRFWRIQPVDRGWYVLRDIVEHVDLNHIVGTRPCVLSQKDKKGNDIIFVGTKDKKDACSLTPGQSLGDIKNTEGNLIPALLPEEFPEVLRQSQLKYVYRARQPKANVLKRNVWWPIVDVAFRSVTEAEAIRHNAIVANSVWYITIADETKDQANRLESNTQYLTDIAHALGAARVALLAAFVCWVGSQPLLPIDMKGSLYWETAIRTGIIFGIFVLFLYRILTSCRRSAYRDINAIRHDVISLYFLEKAVDKNDKSYKIKMPDKLTLEPDAISNEIEQVAK